MSTSDPYVMHREGHIGCFLVRNDKTRASLFYLTQLKIIFQRQLPKMPREYIARLIYDRRHESIILLSTPEKLLRPSSEKPCEDNMLDASTSLSVDYVMVREEIPPHALMNLSVLGGITLRRFGPDRPFLEIVFCAISSAEQVRGYGAFLMSVLKSWVRTTYPCITFMLTYADNYAVGYFKKQGFSRQITLDRTVWGGLIKDYDGGTLMECRLIPEIVDYLSMRRLIGCQREALMNAIQRKASEPFVRHAGLATFPVADPSSIAGLSGRPWQSSCEDGQHPLKRPLSVKDALASLLVDLQTHHSAWPFLEPVKISDVPDYLSIVKQPMDLKTVGTRIFAGHYVSIEEFVEDVMLVFNNCRAYNQEHTPYYKCANVLESYFRDRLKSL